MERCEMVVMGWYLPMSSFDANIYRSTYRIVRENGFGRAEARHKVAGIILRNHVNRVCYPTRRAAR